ncbi:hypothetical protein STANM309S_01982 [Streptomyces tanashiensis]
MSRKAAVVALTALAPISWGSTYFVTTEFLPPDRPLFTGLMRALPAGLLLLALTRKLPQGAWWWKSAVLGALNIGAFFPLLFLAAYRLPGGVAAVVGSVGPLFVVGLAALFLGEKPTTRTLLTAVAAAFGVSLVVLKAGAAFDLVGIVAGLLSSLSMSAGIVFTKRWGRPEGVGALALTGWQLTAGGLVILPVAFLVEGAPARPDRHQPGRLRLPGPWQHGDLVLPLVPRHRAAERLVGHPPRPALADHRGRHRLGGARPGPRPGAGARHADRLRRHPGRPAEPPCRQGPRGDRPRGRIVHRN